MKTYVSISLLFDRTLSNNLFYLSQNAKHEFYAYLYTTSSYHVVQRISKCWKTHLPFLGYIYIYIVYRIYLLSYSIRNNGTVTYGTIIEQGIN